MGALEPPIQAGGQHVLLASCASMLPLSMAVEKGSIYPLAAWVDSTEHAAWRPPAPPTPPPHPPSMSGHPPAQRHRPHPEPTALHAPAPWAARSRDTACMTHKTASLVRPGLMRPHQARRWLPEDETKCCEVKKHVHQA